MSKQDLTRRSFLIGLAGLVTLKLPRAFAQEAAFKPFSFAHVTDCHLINGLTDSYKLTQESQLFFQDAVKQINSHGVDFVLFGGDQVEQPGKDEENWQLFIDIAQGLSAPWQFVLGERDISGLVPADKLRTYGRDWKGKGLPGDEAYFSTDILNGVHLIGLDTARPNNNEGFVGDEQIAWLKNDLAKTQGQFVIVLSHHPLLAPPPYDGGPPWDQYLLSQAASVREILNTSKDVRLSLSGHCHVSKIQREREIWYVSSPSLDVYPCRFRIFHVTDQAINIETYQINYPALIKKARAALISSRLAYDFNAKKPSSFTEVAEGSKMDDFCSLPVASGKAAASFKGEKSAKSKKGAQKSQGAEAAK
jgi:3',5'-cyclic AMP phosphodiesterase CpdA